MIARKLLRSYLMVNKARLDFYDINGKRWFLSAQLEVVLGRSTYIVVSISPNLYTPKLVTFANINGVGARRKFFSVVGARTLGAMTPNRAGLDLFNVMCALEDAGRKQKNLRKK